MSEFITAWSGRVKFLAIAGLPFLWAICLVIFMNITSPLQNGPLSVLAVFSLAYLFIASTLYAVAIIAFKIAHLLGWRRSLHRKQLYYLASVISLGPVLLLALNTLGQLEIKEVILITLLLTIGCFYVLRRSRKEAL